MTVTQSILSFACLQFAFGCFIAGVNPVVNSLAVMNTDACFRGRAFGLMMSANQIGSMIGPLAGGFISAWLGIRFTFFSTGVFLIVVGLLLWRKRRGENGEISPENN